jgi:hypothetical protein
MEWYEIVGFVALWFIGLYLRAKFYEWMRDYRNGRRK